MYIGDHKPKCNSYINFYVPQVLVVLYLKTPKYGESLARKYAKNTINLQGRILWTDQYYTGTYICM